MFCYGENVPVPDFLFQLIFICHEMTDPLSTVIPVSHRRGGNDPGECPLPLDKGVKMRILEERGVKAPSGGCSVYLICRPDVVLNILGTGRSRFTKLDPCRTLAYLTQLK